MCQVIGHPPLAAIREEASDNGLPALEDSVSRVSQKTQLRLFNRIPCIKLHPAS